MTPRITQPIVENMKVGDVLAFLNSCDFDPVEFRSYLSNKFNRTYHTEFTRPQDFQVSDCKLLAQSFKRNLDSKVLKQIIYLFVHHHLMIIQHKLFPDGELRVMRAKISFHSGISLEEIS